MLKDVKRNSATYTRGKNSEFHCSSYRKVLANQDKIPCDEINNERRIMNRSPKESDFPGKQEAHSSDAKAKASSSSAQWLRLKDPRIVRVSRAFGGKDRHSKVCTIRGLRDRRVRLSVPTAIQLYDLQDRLGLSQPSKVVDWLLNAAKNEIDELPPLPMPPAGNFSLSPLYPSGITSHALDASHSNQERFNIDNAIHWENPSGNTLWKSKSKEVSGEMVSQKENWTTSRSSEGNKEGSNESNGAQALPNNLLQRANHHPSLLGLLNTMPLGYQWENSGNESSQTDLHSINVMPFPSSTLSLSSGTSQILVCPPGTTQSYFPSHVSAMDIDPRQMNHFQMLSSSSQNLLANSLSPSIYPVSQSVKPFSLSMLPTKLLLSRSHSESQSQKERDFQSK